MAEIVNRVASSGLITLDIKELFPDYAIVGLDLAPQLWQGLALKEVDFRAWVKENDWSIYKDKHLAVFCSTEAIIPLWAYMLLSSAIQPHASSVHEGSVDEVRQLLWMDFLKNEFDVSIYADQRIILKGCSDLEVLPSVYMLFVQKLQPVAKSIMFGEACSTVPVWKAPKK